MKHFLKNLYLTIDNATLRSRFFLVSEYRRWAVSKEEFSKKLQSFEEFHKPPDVFFLVPGTSTSGGIAVILQYANRLQEKGYSVKILSLNNTNITSWFPQQRVAIYPYKVTRTLLKEKRFDVLIATSHSTAFSVALSQAKRKIYFVQSDESRFFSEDKILTEMIRETYKIPFTYITEAKWIQRWLKEEYGHDSFYVPNGIDLDVFKKTTPIVSKQSKPRILIEGAISIPYKGMDDAYNVVKDLDCELWMVSNDGRPRKAWRYHRFFEKVPYGTKMAEIYSSCNILLKMSRIEGFFGPPMEAMACGCAVVVGKVTGYDEYIVDGKNALVVEQGDIVGARVAIQKLIDDPSLRERLVQNGYRTVGEWSWDRSVHLFESILNGKRSG